MTQRLTWPTFERALLIAEARQKRRFYFACKRLFDIVVAGILLLVLSPLMAIVAVLIVLDSPGPAIFTQQRVGLRRRTEGGRTTWEVVNFDFYKFRTMHQDSDSEIHRAFVQAFIRNDREGMASVQGGDVQVRKIVKDARVTRLGKFLRKSSIDELPQFWNVLKGDMSLVGPRPPIPYEVEIYKPWHRQRLGTIPGVTGLWQVAARSSVDFDDMVKLDLEYIKHQSFWLDIKILLKTPLSVLQSKGAM